MIDKGIFSAAFNIWLSGEAPMPDGIDIGLELCRTERFSFSDLRNDKSGRVNKRILFILQGGTLHSPDRVMLNSASVNLSF